MAIVYKFKADGSQYARGLNDMRDKTKRFSKGISKSMRGGVAAAIVAVGAAVTKVIRDMTELNRTIKKSGVGAEDFQRLAYAAEQSGVSTERFADALKDLDVKLSDGIARGGSFAELITELGMDMDALAEMDPGERFLAFSDAIQDAGGSLSRFGADEFGDAMFELLPLLEKGSEGIKELGANANVVSKGQLAAAERTNKVFSGIMSNMKTTAQKFAIEGVRTFEFLSASVGAIFKELGNNAVNLGKVIGKALTLDVDGAKEAYKELIDDALTARDRISAAGNAVVDKQLAEDKEIDDKKTTSLEIARRKAEIDAAKELSDLEKKRDEAQQKRMSAQMSLQEQLTEATRKRLQLEQELSEIDPFSKGGEKSRAIKETELAKARTEEDAAKGRVSAQADSDKADAAKEQQRIAEAKQAVIDERTAREESQLTPGELLKKRKGQLAEKEKAFASGNGTLADALDIEKLKTEILNISTGIKDDLPKAAEEAGATTVASSLAAIGGGGGVAALGSDPALNESKRQTSVLERIAKNTEAEAENSFSTPEL